MYSDGLWYATPKFADVSGVGCRWGSLSLVETTVSARGFLVLPSSSVADDRRQGQMRSAAVLAVSREDKFRRTERNPPCSREYLRFRYERLDDERLSMELRTEQTHCLKKYSLRWFRASTYMQISIVESMREVIRSSGYAATDVEWQSVILAASMQTSPDAHVFHCDFSLFLIDEHSNCRLD